MSYSHSFDWDVSAWVVVEMLADFNYQSGCPQIQISPCSPHTLSFDRSEAKKNVKKIKDRGLSAFILPVSVEKDEILRIAEEIQSKTK